MTIALIHICLRYLPWFIASAAVGLVVFNIPSSSPVFAAVSDWISGASPPAVNMSASEHLELLKKAMDEFSFKIYHQIAGQANPSTGNLFLSPLSISSALLLVYLGAKSQTRSEIESVLGIQTHFAGNEATVLKAYEEVLKIFVPSKDQQGKNAFELSLANKAYIQQGFQLKPEYVNAIVQNLHSEIGEVPFQGGTEKARLEINGWVEQKTNNKIKDLLAEGMISADTLMVLVNAIYFKADWLNKFDAKVTTKEDFHNLDGQVSKVDLMFIGKKKLLYFDNDEVKLPLPSFQMVVIPYKAQEMSMLVLLPKEKSGLGELEKNLTGDILRNILHACSNRKVDLWLPRFKLEQTYDLVTVLSGMGIKNLFGKADLSGISDHPLVVSGAVHKAFVEVNEAGTEAAAATAVVMRLKRSVGEVDEPLRFRADRSFIFAIKHESTGLIVFLGRADRL